MSDFVQEHLSVYLDPVHQSTKNFVFQIFMIVDKVKIE